MLKAQKLILATCLLFYSFFVLGVLFPEAWWGTHFVSFLHPIPKFGLLFGGLSLILYVTFAKPEINLVKDFANSNFVNSKWALPLTLAIASTFIFCNFPIKNGLYGDARRFTISFETPKDFSDEEMWDLVLDPNFLQSKTGETTVLPAAYLLMKKTGFSVEETFLYFDAFFGFFYIFLTLLFLRYYVENRGWRTALTVIVVTSPILQIFTGHVEIYAPALLFISLFVMTQLMYLKTEKKLYLFALIPITFLMMKVHSSSFLLLPSLGLTVGYAMWKKKDFWKKRFKWRFILMWIVTPLFVAGAYVYFVVLEDHIDERWLHLDLKVMERLFLPIFTPEPPFDKYNLFSLNHFFDYLNMMLIWTAGGMLLFAVIVGFFRKQVNWNSPAIIVTGISILFGFSFFFMVNPLLSMPIDFDLYCLPAPVFILFLAAIAGELKQVKLNRTVLASVFALGLMYIPIFLVNNDAQQMSLRTEAVGVHVFKTYWIHSGDLFVDSHKLVATDGAPIVLNRARELDQKLGPYALPGNDEVFSGMAFRLATYYRIHGQVDSMKYFLERSYNYQSESDFDLPSKLDCLFILGRFDEAYDVSLQLLEKQLPNAQTAVRIALICALEAGKYDAATKHAQAYVNSWPGDPLVQDILTNLKNKTNLDQLKFAFR